MSRDRFHDEEDDYRDDTRPRKSTNPALVIGLMLGGLLAGLVVLCGAGHVRLLGGPVSRAAAKGRGC
jgi:hypothetical protein